MFKNFSFRTRPDKKNEFNWKEKNQQLISLINTGKINEAVPVALELLEYVDKTYKKDSVEKATTYNNTGMAFMLAKDYPLAEMCFRDALEMRKRLFGKDHNEVAVILLNLAQLYKHMARDIIAENREEVTA